MSSKRRRPDSSVDSTPASKRSRVPPSSASLDDEDTKVVLPPRGTTVEELGFDPFAPHPGMTKEQRKVARMIRNRSASWFRACISPSSILTWPLTRTAAAQVSRDRKKEHVNELEDRVRELESQLSAYQRGSVPSTSSTSPLPLGPSDLPFVPLAPSSLVDREASPSPSHLSLSSSQTSTISPLQAASLSQARISSLEEENDALKKRLEHGEREKAELKGRLEGVEKRFEWMERVLAGVVGIAATGAVSSTTTTTAASSAPVAPTSTDQIDWTSLVSSFNPLPAQSTGSSDDGTGSTGTEASEAHINERLVAREESLQRTLMRLARSSLPVLPSSLRRPFPSKAATPTQPARSTFLPCSTSPCSTFRRSRRSNRTTRRSTGVEAKGCGRIRLVVRPPTRS